MSAGRPAALVTGAARRLGRAIAVALAEGGYDVAIHCHTSRDEAATTADAVRDAGAEATIVTGDLANPETLDQIVGEAHARFPRLEVLVNSASRYDRASLRETTAAIFDAQIAVNVRAPFLLMQSFARRVGHGHVVNVADNKVAFTQPAYAAYVLSKKALVELTRMAAVELAPDIRVNAVAPGVVLPAASRSSAYLAWRTEGIPLKTRGEASDVTDAVLYLLRSRFVTGQLLTVDGGEGIAQVGRHAGNAPEAAD